VPSFVACPLVDDPRGSRISAGRPHTAARAGGSGEASGQSLALTAAFLLLAKRHGAPVDDLDGLKRSADLVEAIRALGVPVLELPPLAEPRPFLARIQAFFEARDWALEALGSFYEELRAPPERRAGGAHYTPAPVADELVARVISPIPGTSIRICDPSMGSGAMLLASARALADRFRSAGRSEPEARSEAVRSLFGVDKDPTATLLARFTLWLFARDWAVPPADFGDQRLLTGDALLGLSAEELGEEGVLRFRDLVADRSREEARTAADALYGVWAAARVGARKDAALAELRRWAERGVSASVSALQKQARAIRAKLSPLHWEVELGAIFARDAGFDAFVGNPPWVSYAGRAAQPLEPGVRSLYASNPAFHGYRNLQSLFVHRAAALLRPGGRLGFVLPTSMSDLSGYAPSRAAHDALAVCDPTLPDFGDGGFERVFQPCMGLVSTRRDCSVRPTPAPWPLGRADLDTTLESFVQKLSSLLRFPADVFGERGYQTAAGEKRLFDRTPTGNRKVGLRTGTEVGPFRLSPPNLFCDPGELSGRFRSDDEWRRVAVLIRQTARYPMATLSDGLAFRNSVLAGFATDDISAELLVAYLNASPVRFYHYLIHRDARQGMPQLKIGHLRALPMPPEGAARTTLAEIGARLSGRGRGIDHAEQRELDEAAADALGLDDEERRRVASFAAKG
jgi:hypothetical protein